MHARFHRRVLVALALLAATSAAGCGRDRRTSGDSSPGAPADSSGSAAPALPPDTSRVGHAFLAVYRDGPLDELRVVRATDGALVVGGAGEFPAGTLVTVSLLRRTGQGTLETTATVRAPIDLGRFMSGRLSPLSGPPPPGIHVLRVTVPFGPGDQDPQVLRAADDGRRYHGSGMVTRPDGTIVFETTLEVPL